MHIRLLSGKIKASYKTVLSHRASLLPLHCLIHKQEPRLVEILI